MESQGLFYSAVFISVVHVETVYLQTGVSFGT